MINVDVRLFDRLGWANQVVNLLSTDIENGIRLHGRCNIMLTGGRSAKILYDAWRASSSFHLLKNVNIFLSDERCVSIKDSRSNFGILLDSLFKDGIPFGCEVFRIETEYSKENGFHHHYESDLPDNLELILFSLGDDGHFASIFPQDTTLNEFDDYMSRVIAPFVPYDRITVTPKVLGLARNIYTLAIGPTKRNMLRQLLRSPNDILEYPARLLLGYTWLCTA